MTKKEKIIDPFLKGFKMPKHSTSKGEVDKESTDIKLSEYSIALRIVDNYRRQQKHKRKRGIINKLNLTERQVWEVVKQWYNFIYPEIIQAEDGTDLEEICERNLDIIDDVENYPRN